MPVFESLAEPVAASIFALAQVLGGNIGAAVVVTSLVVRLLMMPLSVKLAQKSFEHRRAVERLRPQLDKLHKRFAGKPEKIAAEMQKLFANEGVKPFDTDGLKGAFLQAPVFILLWTAVRQVAQAGGRFLWIGDLARPDVWLTLIAATLAGLGAGAAGLDSQKMSHVVAVVPVAFTVLFLWKASAMVGLYWASSNLVALVQGRLTRRALQQRGAATA